MFSRCSARGGVAFARRARAERARGRGSPRRRRQNSDDESLLGAREPKGKEVRKEFCRRTREDFASGEGVDVERAGENAPTLAAGRRGLGRGREEEEEEERAALLEDVTSWAQRGRARTGGIGKRGIRAAAVRT